MKQKKSAKRSKSRSRTKSRSQSRSRKRSSSSQRPSRKSKSSKCCKELKQLKKVINTANSYTSSFMSPSMSQITQLSAFMQPKSLIDAMMPSKSPPRPIQFQRRWCQPDDRSSTLLRRPVQAQRRHMPRAKSTEPWQSQHQQRSARSCEVRS